MPLSSVLLTAAFWIRSFKRWALLKNCALEIAGFVAGAAMMAVEIVASRIMAPFLGNSIVVWTSLIGAILAALSCGYWRGGQLADKHGSVQTLSKILMFAAGLTALT